MYLEFGYGYCSTDCDGFIWTLEARRLAKQVPGKVGGNPKDAIYLAMAEAKGTVYSHNLGNDTGPGTIVDGCSALTAGNRKQCVA